MFNNPLKILILVIIVFSKEILVFNEEVLIVLAFSIFIYLVLNGASSMIAEELDEKAQSIQNKFNVYNDIQEKTIVYLCDYYTKREFLSTKIQKIETIQKARVSTIERYVKINCQKLVVSHIEDILTRFVLNEYISKNAFQQRFISKLNKLKSKIEKLKTK